MLLKAEVNMNARQNFKYASLFSTCEVRQESGHNDKQRGENYYFGCPGNVDKICHKIMSFPDFIVISAKFDKCCRKTIFLAKNELNFNISLRIYIFYHNIHILSTVMGENINKSGEIILLNILFFLGLYSLIKCTRRVQTLSFS